MATRYQVLLDERAQLVAEGATIFQAAESAGRSLTAEEITRDDAINARLGEISTELAREEQRRERERTVAAIPSGSGPLVSGLHDRATDKPWGFELGVRMVPQSDGTHQFGGVPHAPEVAVGDFLQAVHRAGVPGGQVDARLFQAAASGGNTSVPSDGGFLVGTDMSMFLFEKAQEESKLLGLCNPIEISEGSDGIEAPYVSETSRATGSRWGGVRVYRRGEADTVTATKPELEMFELRLADLMGIAYVTDRQVQDARALGQVYTKAFASEFGFKFDDEVIRGSGVGECQGVLNSPALVTVNKETGQAAATVVSANLSKMWVRLPTRSKGSAVWFINQELGPQLDELSIPAGTAALEPRFVNYGPDGILRIKGRPVQEIEQCSALGTVGDILLLDLSEYVVIRKGGLGFAESMHVRFLYGENTFRWIQRINGKSPWRSAVTPYKGSATLSPMVALQTRS